MWKGDTIQFGITVETQGKVAQKLKLVALVIVVEVWW